MQRSRSAVIERQVAETGTRAVEKAAETVTELAERAVVVAREAQRVATPALRSAAHSSAETLSHAAERAAVVLADAAERLSQEVAEMPITAKGRRAAKAEKRAARPRRWRRRFRRTLVLTGVAGAVYLAVTKSPLKAKLSEMVFGPPLDEEDLEPITLPVTTTQGPDDGEASEAEDEAGDAKKAPKAKGHTSAHASKDDGAAE